MKNKAYVYICEYVDICNISYMYICVYLDTYIDIKICNSDDISLCWACFQK